jgi:hypothetical protein
MAMTYQSVIIHPSKGGEMVIVLSFSKVPSCLLTDNPILSQLTGHFDQLLTTVDERTDSHGEAKCCGNKTMFSFIIICH